MAEAVAQAVKEADPKQTRANKVGAAFEKEVFALFKKFRDKEKKSPLTPEEFQRAIAFTLIKCAAVTAIDVKITNMQFLGMSKMVFDDAFRRAPKWG